MERKVTITLTSGKQYTMTDSEYQAYRRKEARACRATRMVGFAVRALNKALTYQSQQTRDADTFLKNHAEAAPRKEYRRESAPTREQFDEMFRAVNR